MKASRFILFAILASLITFVSYASPDGKTYTAHRVGNGKRSVNHRRGGIDVPGLSEMYTHCAGGYYFNPTDARK